MADVRRFSDAEIERLIKFYEQAEREILDRLNRALLRGNKIEYLAQMKRNIEAILQQLRDGSRHGLAGYPRVYSEGLKPDAMLKDVGSICSLRSYSPTGGAGACRKYVSEVQDVVQVIGRQVSIYTGSWR